MIPVKGSLSLATTSIFPPTGFRPFSSSRSSVPLTSDLVSSLSRGSTAWPEGEGDMMTTDGS